MEAVPCSRDISVSCSVWWSLVVIAAHCSHAEEVPYCAVPERIMVSQSIQQGEDTQGAATVLHVHGKS